LDRKEGVTVKHTKEVHDIEFWPTDSEEGKIKTSAAPETTPVLLCFNRKRVKENKPKEEHRYRINTSINDALMMGIPLSYMGNVSRRFIPEINESVDRDVLKLIRAQKKTVDL
jgi:gamma-glutamylcyclotransferase